MVHSHHWLVNDPADFDAGPLSEDTLTETPFELFKNWFQLAYHASPETASMMTLATVDAHHRPNARIVLLKSVEENGFIFFTNYQSVKATEMDIQHHVAATFFWIEQKRQVRVNGKVQKISAEESDSYFATRPRESQLGAWASNQSTVIPSREFLLQRYESLEKQYQDREVPRPPHWGGYLIKPTRVEFWQGGDKRLHDRFEYLLNENGAWNKHRLAP